MSTRKGNFVTLDEVNEMCVDKALALLKARMSPEPSTPESPEGDSHVRVHPELSEGEIIKIADQVALGAIVFADLSIDPTKDMEFDVDRVISFEGETGPYLQYAHTRCVSILRKAHETGIAFDETKLNLSALSSVYQAPAEMMLLKALGKFPATLERTLEQRKPSQLCIYLIDLTRDFGVFYRECKVMNPGDQKQSLARIALVEATRRIMALGLDLLGIPKPEKM